MIRIHNKIFTVMIFALLLFFGVGTAAAYWITIDPLSDSEKIIGTPFTVTGTTNLPAGTQLDIRFVPVKYVDVDMFVNKEMLFAKTYVQTGVSPSSSLNIWSYEVNTSNFIPPAYQVTVIGLGPSASADCRDAKPFLVSYPATPSSHQSPGFLGILSLACTLGVFAVFLRRI